MKGKSIVFRGCEFASQSALYRYGKEHFNVVVTLTVFTNRLRLGWDVERALLSEPVPYLRAQPCTDHLGQTFPSQNAMFKHWGISQGCGIRRLRKGWSIKEILTTPPDIHKGSARSPCKDHLGRVYPSVTAMARHYGLTPNVLHGRLNLGWPLMAALTTPAGASRHFKGIA